MKKLLNIFALVAILALAGGMAYANGVCVNVSTATFYEASNLSGGGATCTLSDGLIFGNFNEYAAGGFPSSGASNGLLAVDVVGNALVFTTDGLGAGDVQITFNVTGGGPITSASLSIGPGSVVTEYICGAGFTQPSETCNGGNLLASPGFLAGNSGPLAVSPGADFV
jgi:hypothetical protein